MYETVDTPDAPFLVDRRNSGLSTNLSGSRVVKSILFLLLILLVDSSSLVVLCAPSSITISAAASEFQPSKSCDISSAMCLTAM